MANNKVNTKIKREIVYAVTTHICMLLTANRKASMHNQNSDTMSLDTYIDLLDKYNKLIKDLEYLEDEKGIKGFVVRNDEVKIEVSSHDKNKMDNFGIPNLSQIYSFISKSEAVRYPSLKFIDAITILKLDHIENKAKELILSEKEINELVGLIEFALENYSVESSNYFDEVTLINYLLKRIVACCKNKTYSNCASKYLNVFDTNPNGILRPSTIGSLTFNSEYTALLRNNEGKILFSVSDDGIIKKRYDATSDYLLISSDLLVGLYSNNARDFVLLRKTNYLSSNKYVSVDGSKEYDYHEFMDVMTLRDYLDKLGLSDFLESIYSEAEFKKLSVLLDLIDKETPLDEIRKIASIAASWWSYRIKYPETSQDYSYSFASSLGDELTDEQIERFERLLTREIVMNLIIYGKLTLSVGNNPDAILLRCGNRVGVRRNYPWNSVMKIDLSKVFVDDELGSKTLYINEGKKLDLTETAG